MDDATRRVTRLENEIVETRADLSETIDAIQHRLAPSTLAANAADRVRHTALVEQLRANLLPISAVGTGVAAWLVSRRMERPRHSHH